MTGPDHDALSSIRAFATADDAMALTLDELAREADISPQDIERLIAIGAVRPDAAGAFERKDIRRARLARAFVDAGFGFERVARAVEAGIVDFGFVDRLFLPPAPRSRRTYAEFEASLGSRAPLLAPLIDQLRLARPGPGHHLGTDDEAILERFLDVWGDDPDTAWRAARLVADAMATMTEGWTRLYWERFFDPLFAAGRDPEQARAATNAIGAEIASLGLALVIWLEQRYLEAAIETVNVEFIEAAMAERGLAPPRPATEPAILFVDVAGYTTLTEELGDERAAEVAARLRAVAEAAARNHQGRLVKLLGDGAMLAFPDVGPACASAAALMTGWVPAQPGLHIGIGIGPLIERDGDYFGSTVNLAARLAQAADPGQVLVGRVRGSAPLGDGLAPAGNVHLKGLSQPVAVSRVVIG
jgi:adenylate cyclase